eukprot:SAG22_NODE_2428_length_2581_cov_1.791700_1_plen_88_part_00
MHELATRDAKIGPHYQKRWAALPTADVHTSEGFLANVSKWSWGHSDFDWCCDDNKAPSYLLYMVTRIMARRQRRQRRHQQQQGRRRK